jgi:glycosyltransferase involved in cell wall biosynthesis
VIGEQEATASSARPTRVLVLASTFPRWPYDTEPPFVYNLSRHLTERFDVVVLAPHAPGAKDVETMDGMEVHRFHYAWPEKAQLLAYGGMLPNLKRNPWLWGLVPWFLATELVSTIRLVRSHQIDVIHAHWLVPQGLVAALAATIVRKPVVMTAHGGDVYGLRGKWASAFKRWALSRMTRVTAVSRDLADAIRELDSHRPVDVISMGVDVTRFRRRRGARKVTTALNVTGPVILFVGRLAEKKGVRYLIEAMPEVLEQVPDATLVIVGDGPLRQDLEQRVSNLGISASVRFTGAKSPEDLPQFYSAADLLVAPSIVADGGDTEAFGLVIAEAMACGCPVIASDVGGIGDLIKHEMTGLLVQQRDSSELAVAVCRVLADDVLRQRMRRMGGAHVKRNFAQTVITERYETALREAAA